MYFSHEKLLFHNIKIFSPLSESVMRKNSVLDSFSHVDEPKKGALCAENDTAMFTALDRATATAIGGDYHRSAVASIVGPLPLGTVFHNLNIGGATERVPVKRGR